MYSSAASEFEQQDTRCSAQAKFLKDSVAFGEGEFGPQSCQGRLGYSMPEEFLNSQTVQLWPIPKHANFIEHGFELLDVSKALSEAGITEANMDACNPEHRRIVGKVLMEAAEARFGKRAIHLADTSRVSGSAVYGEATVRNTGASSTLRAAQHIFHLDKFLPGIAKLYSQSGSEKGAEAIVNAYWRYWEPDFTHYGVTKEQAVSHTCCAAPGMLNLWVSLTPGEIKQQPLAVADMRNILLDDSDVDLVSTHKIIFPGLEDTITVLRPRAIECAKLMYRPNMKFGEVILFSTTHTPHSAVWLDGQPEAARCSAEIRLLLVDA